MKYVKNKIFISIILFEIVCFAESGPAKPAVHLEIPEKKVTLRKAGQANTQWEIGNPSSEEIYILELINRARLDPLAEIDRLRNTTHTGIRGNLNDLNEDVLQQQFELLAIDLQEDLPLPPFAMNAKLLAAAQMQAQSLSENEFYGHCTYFEPFDQDECNNRGSQDVQDRADAQGYYAIVGECSFSLAVDDPEYAHAAFVIDWDITAPNGIQDPPGHRNLIYKITVSDYQVREIGIGWFERGTCYNCKAVVEDFGVPVYMDQPYICGVVFDDINENDFYDIGEGVGNIRIDVEGENFYAVSTTSGGYTIPVTGNGSYKITFSGGYNSITINESYDIEIINNRNFKQDLKVNKPSSIKELTRNP